MYRIMTQDKGNIVDLAVQYLSGFTAYPALGCHKGLREHSYVIEVEDTRENVLRFCKRLKEINRQSSVLLQTVHNKVEFI